MMKYPLLCLVFSVLCLGCGPNNKVDDDGPALFQMQALKADLCACADSDCVKKLASKERKESLMKALANSSEADKKAFLKVGKEADACIARINENDAAREESSGKATPKPTEASSEGKAAGASGTDSKKKSPSDRAQKNAAKPPKPPEVEIPALQFHIERHTRHCACKKLMGAAKTGCVKDAKAWESAHTIQKSTEPLTDDERRDRGVKIKEALAKIPCDGPAGGAGGVKAPAFKIGPGATLKPSRAMKGPAATKTSPQPPSATKTK